MYKDIFDQAETELGIRTLYSLTDLAAVPQGWQGKTGRVSDSLIREEIPDYRQRLFYLSGPHAMVSGFEQTLLKLGINESRIKKDFFPGFA